MKHLIVLASLLMGTGSAFASSANSGLDQVVMNCSDPRTLQHYTSEADATAACSSLSNVYVSVWASYDYGFGSYTCQCTDNGNQGNNGGGGQ